VAPQTLRYLQGHFNSDPLIFSILEDPDHPAWDNRETPEREDALSVGRLAFRLSVEDLRQRYGREPDSWSWQKTAPFVLKHTFGDIQIMGYLNRGPLPTRGTGATVFMHRFSRQDAAFSPIQHGSVLRLVVDFGNPASSLMSIPGGQSGNPGSPHYDDLLPLYLAGEGIPVLADPELLARAARVRLILHPTP
jgi:penicillin G amidase